MWQGSLADDFTTSARKYIRVRNATQPTCGLKADVSTPPTPSAASPTAREAQ